MIKVYCFPYFTYDIEFLYAQTVSKDGVWHDEDSVVSENLLASRRVFRENQNCQKKRKECSERALSEAADNLGSIFDTTEDEEDITKHEDLHIKNELTL